MSRCLVMDTACALCTVHTHTAADASLQAVRVGLLDFVAHLNSTHGRCGWPDH